MLQWLYRKVLGLTLADVLVYPTTKYIVIKDRPLALAYMALQLAVLGYMIYSIYFHRSFLVVRAPSGKAAAFLIFPDIYDDPAAALAAPICNCAHGSSYPGCAALGNVSGDGDGLSCVLLPAAEASDSDGGTGDRSSVFVATLIHEETSFGLYREDASACPPSIDDRNLSAHMGRTCVYPSSRDFVPYGVEHVSVGVTYSDATGAATGPLPCTVRRKGDARNLMAVPDARRFNASLVQWLQWAGVSLDEGSQAVDASTPSATAPPSAAGGGAATVVPAIRASGASLKIDVLRYNWGLAGSHAKRGRSQCFIQVEAVLEATAGTTTKSTIPGTLRYGWSTLEFLSVAAPGTALRRPSAAALEELAQVDFTTTTRASTGVRFEVAVGGQLGKFSIAALVIAITSGIVLSTAAGAAVQVFAMFGRGPRSEVYYSVIREVIDYKRIFARFALRCLTAAFIYAQMDDDRSQSIDAKEMYYVLKGVFEDHLSEDETIALTDFVMTTVGSVGDATERGQKLCFMEQKLSRLKFMECFVDDEVCTKNMRSMLAYKTREPYMTRKRYSTFKSSIEDAEDEPRRFFKGGDHSSDSDGESDAGGRITTAVAPTSAAASGYRPHDRTWEAPCPPSTSGGAERIRVAKRALSAAMGWGALTPHPRGGVSGGWDAAGVDPTAWGEAQQGPGHRATRSFTSMLANGAPAAAGAADVGVSDRMLNRNATLNPGPFRACLPAGLRGPDGRAGGFAHFGHSEPPSDLAALPCDGAECDAASPRQSLWTTPPFSPGLQLGRGSTPAEALRLGDVDAGEARTEWDRLRHDVHVNVRRAEGGPQTPPRQRQLHAEPPPASDSAALSHAARPPSLSSDAQAASDRPCASPNRDRGLRTPTDAATFSDLASASQREPVLSLYNLGRADAAQLRLLFEFYGPVLDAQVTSRPGRGAVTSGVVRFRDAPAAAAAQRALDGALTLPGSLLKLRVVFGVN